MTRIATIPLQQSMSDAIQRSQQKLAVSQAQLSTGKKAPDFASLGAQAVRNLSAHSLVSREKAHSEVASQVGTTLSIYDSNISAIETMASDLKQSATAAIGTQDSTGLQDAINAAFAQFRSSMNATAGGVPIFSGSQTSLPFTPEKLADTAGLAPSNAFTNDQVRASARVGDGIDVQYGVTASELGTDMLAAFRTLAEAGTFGDRPTEAQTQALRSAIGQIGDALGNIRGVNAENGRKQAQLETLGTRADQRSLIYQDVIGRNEDADLGQVAIDLAQQQAVLQASYVVFGKLSGLSLADYLR
ncbi:flagellin [Sphingomonas aerophila]|uniref:Flagellar hook-associated protein 3 FlgL n=1 Tax=Sphingomonas aerophila TaxID=1344948 RepID=A0A7W9ET02_9SPHN|nr:flagellin [Sphingomonas aerophila]MBB5713674.1 flagellar hook-associated protein 3 FlgL [Sphingomonas aerophila]